MQDPKEHIALYDTRGNQIDYKEYGDINRKLDTLGQANVLMVDGTSVLLTLPRNSLWPGKWSSSASTFIREGEREVDAARRAILSDYRTTLDARLLGRGFYNFDGVERWMAFFRAPFSETRPKDILMWEVASLSEIERRIGLGTCSPTLAAAFEYLRHK